jgi:CRISPR-associated endonuclease/helicase Cas3
MDKRMPVDRPATPVFYAHSLPGGAREEWERLEWHLRRAGALARRFARSFGAGNWGAAAGLLHDLGKYSQEFQGMLNGDYGRVDHSTAGAQEAKQCYGHAGILLAYGIAGHHAGLPDGGEADNSALVSRLNNKKTVPAVDNSWHERITLPERAQLEAEIRAVLGKGGGFPIAFFARMLFSCLVDADFIATEWFLDKKRRRERGRRVLQPSDLAPVLHAYLGTRFGPPDTEINRQRAAIREACEAAAHESPGVFSLSVPTGGGKTLSSLSFALEHAAKHNLARVIYAVPYTAIIEQIADEFRKALATAGGDAVLEHHSAAEPPPTDETHLVGPQRLYLATENWDAPLIVTTTVQLFESLFAARPSRCRKLHNLARSVIVLDEVQALPLGQLHACLASLGELVSRYGTTVVLCSATVPDFKASGVLSAALPEPRPIVPQTPALHAAFTRVRSEYADPLDDEMLAARLAEVPQVLCIVDTRAHAAELFDRLPGEGRFHLSASMCPAHRRQELRRAKAALNEGRLCRLIATKVIEAGVDISFPEVWRTMAGIDSLAQAAGRCNRHGEKRDGLGKFVVFESLRKNALPTNLVDLRRRRTIAGYILGDHQDPIASGAVAAYFARLFKDSDDMDAEKCWKALADVRDITAIPFRSVAEKFHMIDDDQTPLFVPWNDEARRSIERLSGILRRQTEAPRRIPLDLLRGLQAYAVGVHGLEQLHAHIEPLDPEGRFHVLHDDGLYDSATGLRLERAGLRSPSANVL